MKQADRLLVMLLAWMLVLGSTMPCYAAEDVTENGGGSNDQIVVGTLEELQTALGSADDGERIYLSRTITVECGQQVSAEINVTMARADSFVSGAMIRVHGGATLCGLRFEECENKASTVLVDAATEEPAIIEKCTFDSTGNHLGSYITISGGVERDNLAEISDCTFYNNGSSALSARKNTSVSVKICEFEDNVADLQGGAIYNSGEMVLDGCRITKNEAYTGGGVFSFGTISISACIICENQIRSTEEGAAVDVFSLGILTIEDESIDTEGYYDLATGNKIPLPLVESTETAKLIYLTDEKAKEYFSTESITELEPEPSPEPTPIEPDEGQREPSQEPQIPTDSREDDWNEYIPPHDFKPSDGNTEPSGAIPEPEPTPMMICGDAEIDVSQSVVLVGYDDGLLHPEDPLTRAQLATIIYRLLTDDTIVRYDTGANIFVDIPPELWCYRYVNTIGNAGIVNGTGNGNYSPNEIVTWEQVLTILNRFVEAPEYDLQCIQYDGWAVDAIKAAVAMGWISDNESFEPDAIITRGELVAFLNGVLKTYR